MSRKIDSKLSNFAVGKVDEADIFYVQKPAPTPSALWLEPR